MHLPDTTPQPPALAEHPADIADHLEQVSAEEAAAALRALPPETASEVLAELDGGVAADVTAQLSSREITDLIEKLPHDEAADIAAELPPEQQQEVLAQLEPPESVRVTQLMRYPEDSAGGIMKDEFIALSADSTIEQGLQTIRNRGESEPEGRAYIYVVDDQQKLNGIVSLRDLVFRNPGKAIREVMRREVHYVRVDTDQEEIARLFSQYHYMALPVVEADGRLVGLVEANQVIGIIQEEVTEDMQRMVGMTGEESACTPWRRSLGMRVPWLYVNLLTACLAATVIALFQSTLAQWTALAVFLPVIAGQSGNAGMQALTVTIRSLALGELDRLALRRVLFKELTVGLLNGLAFGAMVALAGWLWKGSPVLGLVVFVAMFLNMVAAAAAGVLIPLGLRALRVDPALSSSIFLTTVTDVAGFLFFLGAATLLLRWFGRLY